MRLLALLLGLVLPACAGQGTEGLPAATPVDFAHLTRPATPNTALAAPPGFSPAPDLPTRPYLLPPQRLYELMNRTIAAQPRTFPHARDDARLQSHWVARTALLNFPDLVTLQVLPGDAGGSRLILWSRSVYGHSDLGTNRRRLAAWLAALDSATDTETR